MRHTEQVGGGTVQEDDVMASEVANYVFCAKAWHLECVLEATASTSAEEKRAAGVLAH